MLDYTGRDRTTNQTTSNTEKGNALANAFSPHSCYPEPADIFRYFTRSQIRQAAEKLPAFKAPGPDGVPNAVLKQSMDMQIDRLYFIFRGVFELDVYSEE